MALPLTDEEAFVFPDAWRRQLHPRRGGAPGPAVKPDKKAGPKTDAQIAEAHEAWIGTALKGPTGNTTLVEAMRQTLDGVPNPLGAAGLARAALPMYADNLTPFADAWFLRHGAAFAAAATVQAAKIYAADRMPNPLCIVADEGYYTPPMMKLLRRTRTLLAACSDEDYAKAVEALREGRDCCASCRAATSYLVPTEAEWVLEACRKHADTHSGASYYQSQLLRNSLSTIEQVDALGGAAYANGPEMLITMVDGLGTAAIPLSEPSFNRDTGADSVRAAAGIVAELPGDEPMRFLLGRLNQPQVLAAVLDSALTRPRRAIRLLAEASQGTDETAQKARELLLRYVRSNREDAASLAGELPDAEKQLMLELLASSELKPEASADDLPPLLVAPPWSETNQKAPKLPGWLAPGALPQVVLADGGLALPEAATAHLLGALSFSTLGKPYPGLADAVAALDRGSAEAFAWAAFATWRDFEHPKTEAWTLAALGLLGNDETVAKLVPVIKAWPGESGHHRAVAGLDVLEAIGTDFALQRINEIAQRVQFKALKERSREKIAAIAARLGLTSDQLADRLVPDLGLDPEGGLWLDYGPRRFRVGFDEQLKPNVCDESGARRKDLPPPNSKDDAELAAAARKQYSALKKEARSVAADAIRRLETALADQRSWTAAEFTDLLAGHPLLRHVVRRLVWVAEIDGAREGFRVAEDGTFADAEDEAYALADSALVRLAHPLTWAEGLSRWGEIFSDYEILQPFEQLGREVYALTPEELEGAQFGRFEGVTLPVGKLLGLTKAGWQRSQPMDAGIQNCVYKRLPGGRYLVIDIEPGIAIGWVNDLGDQTLNAVYLTDRAQDYHRRFRGDADVPLSELDPLTVSELLRELNRLVD